MAFHSACSAATDSPIQGRYRTTLHLFSILVSLFIAVVVQAQPDSASYRVVGVERKESLQRLFSKETIASKPGYRILHFGDSHIQADRITGEIRKALQEEFGNGGSGLFLPYALCGSFGPAGTKSSIKGGYSWSTYLKNPEGRAIGILGYEISFKTGAQFSMSFSHEFKGRPSNEINIWIHSPTDTHHIEMGPEFKLMDREVVNPSLFVYRYSADSPIQSIAFKTNVPCALWGLEFPHRTGLIYQQCGLVGAQFTHLIRHKSDCWDQLLALDPDLIVFSYGTNESYWEIDSLSYLKQLRSLIDEMKKRFPDAGFLISNAPDTRSSGRIPVSEISVNSMLYQVANDLEVPFFDLHRAMGGWGSLYRWNKKNLFQSDLLHFNQEGSSLVSRLFTYAFFEAGGLNPVKTDRLRNELVQSMSDVLSNDLFVKDTTGNTQILDKNRVVEPKRKVYVVKSGDTLSEIAMKTKRSVKELVRINKLKSRDKINKGQKLYY